MPLRQKKLLKVFMASGGSLPNYLLLKLTKAKTGALVLKCTYQLFRATKSCN